MRREPKRIDTTGTHSIGCRSAERHLLSVFASVCLSAAVSLCVSQHAVLAPPSSLPSPLSRPERATARLLYFFAGSRLCGLCNKGFRLEQEGEEGHAGDTRRTEEERRRRRRDDEGEPSPEQHKHGSRQHCRLVSSRPRVAALAPPADLRLRPLHVAHTGAQSVAGPAGPPLQTAAARRVRHRALPVRRRGVCAGRRRRRRQLDALLRRETRRLVDRRTAQSRHGAPLPVDALPHGVAGRPRRCC